MNVEQIYTQCLAQGTYYLQSDGAAAVIDPLREVATYIQRAQADGVRIKYIFETHFHADFVSGHLTLAEKTGATIVYGPGATPNFKAYIAKDNETFQIGNLTLKALHTPGHTLESTTYLLLDSHKNQKAIFTGDTLFLGDVGRPDLAQKSDRTMEQLAGILYDSLRKKIMPLEDRIIVYPGHGAGSACGKNMMKATTDTLGNQKKINYALRSDMTREEFIQEVIADLPSPPPYFSSNVKMNKEGYPSIDRVLEKGLTSLSPNTFEKLMQPGTIVLDVRAAADFCHAHIPKSIFIGLDGGFAPWVGALLKDVNVPILLVAPKGREEEAVTRLARVGFDNTLGYLESLQLWEKANKPIEKIDCITVAALQKQLYQENIFDVRTPKEYKTQHVKNAHHTPLSDIAQHAKAFKKHPKNFLYCQGGYRSVIACSVLKKLGYQNIVNILGGFGAIKENQHIVLE